MLLGTLLLALVIPAPAPATPKPADARAECLKKCAGAPKDATGQQLLQCLQRCEPPTADAGMP